MFPTSWDSQLTRRVCFVHSHPDGENFHLHTSRAWEDVKVTLGASLPSLPLTLFLHCIFSAFIFGLFPYFPWRSTPIFLRPSTFHDPRRQADQAGRGLGVGTTIFPKHSPGHLVRHPGVSICWFLYYFLQRPLHLLAFFYTV